MRHSITKIVIVICLAVMVGCASTPEHTNTLIFGTTTKFALDVSVNAAGATPDFTLGYKRHEGVWMPLLANSKTGSDTTPALCSEGNTNGNSGNTNNCLFNGVEVNDKSKKDAYSVLASFGAEFGGGAKSSASGESPNASENPPVGLAQFFATGIAAQNLALRDGARLVAVQSVDEKLLKNVEQRAKRAEEQEEKLRMKLDDELYEKSYQEGYESAKALEGKIQRILREITPFNEAKWKGLVDKASVKNKEVIEGLEELKGSGGAKEGLNLDLIKSRLKNDQTKNGDLINSLYNAILNTN